MRGIRIFSFLAGIVLIVSGCATTSGSGPNLTATQLQKAGEQYLGAGDTANALKYLTEAEQKKPDSPEIQYALGLAYNQRGLTEDATAHFQKALKIKPNYPEALNAAGVVYAQRGQVELAQESFQKAMADPFYQTPQLAAYNLGRLYEQKGDLDRALPMYQQAVRFQPAYGQAWFRIGKICEAQQRGDEARQAYGKAVEGAPDLAEAHLRFGVMSYLAGDLDSALSSLTRVIKLAPNTAMADEATLYLKRMDGAARTGARHESELHPSQIDVIRNQDLRRQQVKSTLPPPAPAQKQPVLDLPGTQPSPAPAAAAQPEPEQAQPSPLPEMQSFNYIVQLGSFVDRQKAEEIRDSLKSKGYSAIVKPMKHQVMGQVYLIQLKPVSTFSKASTLMTQLEGEIPGEPVIIKVPVAPKSVESQQPQPPPQPSQPN